MGENGCQIHFSKAFSIFLRKRNADLTVEPPIFRNASIKDIIESYGIPHTEVGAIEARERGIDLTSINVESIFEGHGPTETKLVSFDHIPRMASRLFIHPVSPPFTVLSPSMLRPRPLKHIRFIVDVNVGKLVPLLRMIGMDTTDSIGLRDAEIAEKAEIEGRIVLSKDIGLLKRKRIAFGRYVREIYPDKQVTEIVEFFGLRDSGCFFSRCLCCNHLLQKVEKGDILHRLEPKTRKYYHHFKQCPFCDKIFWKGSHYESMEKRLRSNLDLRIALGHY